MEVKADQLRQVWLKSPDLQKEFPTFGNKGVSGDWNIYDWAQKYPQDYSTKLQQTGITATTQPSTQKQPATATAQPATGGATGTQPAKATLAEGTLIRAKGTPEIYVVTPDGTKRHIPNPEAFEQEFGNKGWSKVKDIAPEQFNSIPNSTVTAIQPTTSGATRTQPAIGTQVGASDILTDNQLWDYWQEIRENETGIGPKLYEVYSRRPDLQNVFDSSGNGKSGSGAEGFTLEGWAMKYGWTEEPTLVAYKPENVVRSVYRFPFRGTDPLSKENYDAGALDWVNAIKNNSITSSKSLLGQIKLDSGNEWNGLSDTEKTAILIDAYIPSESLVDTPKFADYFKEQDVRKEIEDRVNKIYDTQLNNFLQDQETKKNRTIEDWQTLTKDLSEDEEKDLTDTQRTFRQYLTQATEGYAAGGLTYSSIRAEKERQLKETLGVSQEAIKTAATRKLEESAKIKERTMADIAREAELKRQEIETRLKPAETETALTTKRAQALTQYQLLQQQTEEDRIKAEEETKKKAISKL